MFCNFLIRHGNEAVSHVRTFPSSCILTAMIFIKRQKVTKNNENAPYKARLALFHPYSRQLFVALPFFATSMLLLNLT